jgi:hypothetical protein
MKQVGSSSPSSSIIIRESSVHGYPGFLVRSLCGENPGINENPPVRFVTISHRGFGDDKDAGFVLSTRSKLVSKANIIIVDVLTFESIPVREYVSLRNTRTSDRPSSGRMSTNCVAHDILEA